MDADNRISGSFRIRPSVMRRRWFPAVAGAVVLTFLQAELAVWVALPGGVAVAQEAGARRLALFVVAKSKKDDTAAMVLHGLLRGTADRLAQAGVERAWTSAVADPGALSGAVVRVDEGRKALAAGKSDDALRVYGEAEVALNKALGAADRALVAKVYKGLGVAQAAKSPDRAKAAMRRSNVVYPGQKPAEYAYAAEARDMFAGVVQEAEQGANGSLSVTASSAGAEVYVDGDFRGFSPARVAGLSGGDHLVTVWHDGSNLWSQFVAIRAGVEESLEVPLVAADGLRELPEAVGAVAKALDKGKFADADAARLATLTRATDVVVLQVSMEKAGFGVAGMHWRAGTATQIKRLLPRDATLVAAAQAILADSLGVNAPIEAPLAQLEPAPVAMPGAAAMQPLPGQEGEDQVIDPNSPIFKETGKKSTGMKVVKQWWFWTAIAVVAGGAATGIYFLSRSGGGGHGPTGNLTLTLHGAK